MKKITQIIAICVSCSLGGYASAEIYKCKGPENRIVLQQTRCPDSGETVGQEIERKNAAKRAEIEKQQQKVQADYEAADLFKNCGAVKLPSYPEIGWTENRFLQCSHAGSGRTSFRESVYQGRTVRQHIVELANGTSYVYTTNGIVNGIQKPAQR